MLKHADLIRNAGFGGANRSYAAYSFVATHVRYLLGELGVSGDLALLAVALLAPLELPILDQQVRIERTRRRARLRRLGRPGAYRDSASAARRPRARSASPAS